MALVQTANSGSGSASISVAATFASAQTLGNLNYAVVSYGDFAIAPVDAVTVSDTVNGAYTAVGPAVTFTAGGSGGDAIQVFYFANAAAANAGVNVVTATRAGSSQKAYFTVAIFEQSGLATSSPVDIQASGSASQPTGSTTASSGAATTTTANDLVVGAFCLFDGSGGTIGGFTQRAAYYTVLVEDQVLASPGSITAQATSLGTGGWAAQLVAFKPVAAAPVVAVTSAAPASALDTLTQSVVGANSASVTSNLLTQVSSPAFLNTSASPDTHVPNALQNEYAKLYRFTSYRYKI